VALVLAALALGACAGAPTKQAAPTTTVAPTTTTTAAPLSAGQQVSFYVPVTGNCFDQRTVGAAPSTSMIFLLLPCRLPHQSEVYATVDYPGTTFPGTSLLEHYAKQTCVRHFAAYVGRPYETSKYDIAYDLPDQKGWDNGIRHVIGCLVASADTDRLAGTVRGSKQ
jgi:Septum formation